MANKMTARATQARTRAFLIAERARVRKFAERTGRDAARIRRALLFDSGRNSRRSWDATDRLVAVEVTLERLVAQIDAAIRF